MKDFFIHIIGGKTQKEINDMEGRLILAKAELNTLKNREKKERPIIDITIGDVSPVDYEKRKAYVAQVAGFHKTLLSPKIKEMISTLRGEFEKVSRDTFGLKQVEYDMYLKGSINALWLLDEWGENMINEQVSYQQGISGEEVEKLKDKIK